MNYRLRQERNNFLLLLGAAYVSLMCALPIVTAGLSTMQYARAQAPAPQLTFEQLDRDRDGYVNRYEAESLPALQAVFNDADRRSDGRLDKVEFARGLAMITDRRITERNRP